MFNSIMLSAIVVFVVLTVVVDPSTVKSPDMVTDPATSKDVPFNNLSSSLFSRALIVLEPALIVLNSIAPSSEPSDASKIFPDILAYVTAWSASFSPLKFILPR